GQNLTPQSLLHFYDVPSARLVGWKFGPHASGNSPHLSLEAKFYSIRGILVLELGQLVERIGFGQLRGGQLELEHGILGLELGQLVEQIGFEQLLGGQLELEHGILGLGLGHDILELEQKQLEPSIVCSHWWIQSFVLDIVGSLEFLHGGSFEQLELRIVECKKRHFRGMVASRCL
uniref:Uncharacterized protein n=1 Tax=Megaselia scalaris TaxID=36166 RepID=T1GAP3_MEGSC